MIKDLISRLKKPASPAPFVDDSQVFKQKIKFELSLFTEDWMKITKEDLKRVFNMINICKITAYFLNYHHDTRFLRYNIMEKNTKSGEQTREWLENIVADLLWTGFGKEVQQQYDKNRFESFNKLIKWIKHVEPFTCINLAYNGEKKNASYTFFLQSFQKEIIRRRYGESQLTYSLR